MLVSPGFYVCYPSDSPQTGFSVTPAELAAQVKEYVASSAATGWANLGATIGALKGTDLRWANPLELKNAVEAAFIDKFGAKEAAKPKGKVCSPSFTYLFL